MVSIIKNYPWQCMECKTCVQCMDPYDEDKMMFCDRCDRGYHTFCVGLKAIPTGRTVTITSQNQKSLSQTENLLTMLTVGNKDYIRCHYSQIIVVPPWIATFPHDYSLN
ncbi:finger 10-like [Octopus vulgaris]|uniref:Finger 10-like n=1 Tax=Octopus vulgaris TaxID=6645 RepID=A0AA36BA71_OCTVU|nr:finger 10-like [Octopus vulgaris]